MPEKKTRQRAATKKSPSSQAGEYVREEIEHVREGKHGARSPKQAIAIGLSKARRAGVKIPPPLGGKPEHETNGKVNAKRSRASTNALKKEGKSAVSHAALSKHAQTAAKQRGPAKRKAAANKAAHTRARASGGGS